MAWRGVTNTAMVRYSMLSCDILHGYTTPGSGWQVGAVHAYTYICEEPFVV